MLTSKIPTSANSKNPITTMTGIIGERCKLIKHAKCFQKCLKYSPSSSSSSTGNQKFLSAQVRTTSDQKISSQVDGRKNFLLVQQKCKNCMKTSENDENSSENELKKMFTLMTLSSSELLPVGLQQFGQWDQFLTLTPSHSSSPSTSPVGTMVMVESSKEDVVNWQRTASSPSSTSLAKKSVQSLESFSTNFDQSKMVGKSIFFKQKNYHFLLLYH